MENNLLSFTADEQVILESVYGRQMQGIGYNPRKLEGVKDLLPQELKFFTGKNFMTAHFFVQSLYKVRGSVNPLKFNLAVNRLISTNENLRVNFCDLGTRIVKVIRPASFIKPEIVFRNLMSVKTTDLDEEFRRIFEADTRREVDLRYDPLIRFAVYKTSQKEFAVFVNIAQIIFDKFDAEEFFYNLLDIAPDDKSKKSQEELPAKNYEAILEYWSKIFRNTPPPAFLPYEQKTEAPYQQKTFRTTIPSDIISHLRGYAQSNRMILMAILQSAWGFMLQLNNKHRDCIFCQVASAANGMLNVIPVRLKSNDTSTIEQIALSQFRQLLVSQPYSLSDWIVLDELTAQRKLFNHVISFKEFTTNESGYGDYVNTPAEPQGKIIYRGAWNVQDVTLSLCFRYVEDDVHVNFTYDASKFLEGGGEKLYKLYLTILQQIIVDWNETFAIFANHFAEHLKIQTEAKNTSPEDNRKKLINFLSQLPILQGRLGGTMKFFENLSKLVTYYEGDRISGDILKENFIFVADGILSRNMDTGDGWYNTLDIIEKNCFVNPTNLLDEQRFKLSVTVLTDHADLLLVPHDVLIETMRKNAEVAILLTNYAVEQMERYQTVWLQASIST